MNVARNVMLDPRLVPGGGAAEMALAHVSRELLMKNCYYNHVAGKSLYTVFFNLQYTLYM